MHRLPDDVLADVLRRLPARSLAAARCVCQDWLALVDDGSLLQQVAALLPQDVRGLFVILNMPDIGFFARPSPAGAAIPGHDLDYLSSDYEDDTIDDHCNGLLLLFGHIVNPATRQWCRLPPIPQNMLDSRITERCYYGLVFDPAVSPHYEVYVMPLYLYPLSVAPLPPSMSPSDQWPPSPLFLHVFSSRTGQWENKPFVREGDNTMGIIADVYSTLIWEPYCETHSVYLQGALYMHCQHDCIVKITPADHKYRVIKLPGNFVLSGKSTDPYLGKSKDRVCYALVTSLCRLQIWFLNETESSSSSSSSLSSSSYDGDGYDYEWVLKHEADLAPIIASYPCNDGGRQWIWHNFNTKEDKNRELPAKEEEFEWAINDDDDSNDIGDNSSGTGEGIIQYHNGRYISVVLGFHPFKDIVFLYDTDIRVFAYHYNNNKAKVQDLGMMFLYHSIDRVTSSFSYTPCWIRDLPGMQYG